MNEGALVLTPDGTVMYSNSAFADMVDLPLEQVIGSRIHRFVHEPHLDAVDELLREGQHSDAKCELVLRNESKDALVPSQISVGKLPTESEGMSAVVTDMTEHKRTQAELETYREHLEELVEQRTAQMLESEARATSILNASTESIWLFDKEGRILGGNAIAFQIWGLTPSEVIGKIANDFVPSDIAASRQRIFDCVIRDGVSARWEDKRADTVFDHSAYPVKNSKGEVTGITVFSRDITERKRDEEALLESKERLNRVLESITDGYYVLDAEWRFVELNTVAEKHFGCPAQELIGKDIWQVTSKTPESLIYRMFHKASAERKVLTFEAQSDIRPGYWSEIHLYPRNGMLEVYFKDISSRKQAEEALRESETKFRAVFDSTQDAIVIADNGGCYIDANPSAESVFGVTPKQLLGRSICDFMEERYDLEAVWAEFLRRGSVKAQLKIVRPDGSVREVEGQSVANILPDRHLSVLHDITDRVRAEEDLKAAKDLLEHQVYLLQRALIPAKPQIVDGYSVGSAFIPAHVGTEVGGDFLDVFRTEDGKVGILIGDVSGKGIESAALAATTRSTVSAFAYDSSCSGDALTHANSRICAHQINDMQFVTSFLAILDPLTGDISFSGAGHPPAIVSCENGDMKLLYTHNMPLGVQRGVTYEDDHYNLKPGERLILYTDGITEARHDLGLFGTEGIQSVLSEYGQACAEELVTHIVDAARKWANGKLRDDTAVLVVRREM